MAREVGASVDGTKLSVRAAAFDRIGACAVVLDGQGLILETNESWRLFTHLNDGDFRTTGPGVDYLGVCDRAAAAGVDGAGEVAAGLRRLFSGERQRFDLEYPCPSPTEDRWYLLEASSAPIADGTGAVLFHVDITTRKLLSDRLTALAENDALTGLPNRRCAVRYLEEQLTLAGGRGGSVWVHFIDLNDFKSVNDRYGHHVGDELLCKVAVRAQHRLRAEDHLCRFGGDEFVLISPGLDRSGAAAVAGRLRTLMDEPFQIGAIEVFGRVSVGVAGNEPDGTIDSLLQAADQDMYRDKHGPSRERSAAQKGARLSPASEEQEVPASGAVPADPARGLSAQVRRLAVLARAQRAIASQGFDLNQIADPAGEWALALSAADSASIEVRDGHELVCRSATGAMQVPVGARRPLHDSIAEACMSSGSAVVIAGTADTAAMVEMGVRSMVIVPLVATDGVPAEGVLTVTSTRAEAFQDHDVSGLEVIAGIVGGVLARAAHLVVLRRAAARYRTLVEHLPGTAVMVFDQHLCLQVVAGPGTRLWRYAERNVEPGRFLHELVAPEELAILEPFYRSAFTEPGTIEYHSAATGLDFHFAAVPIPNALGDAEELLVAVTDVTQAKADEQALRDAESRFRTAFEEGPVGMARTALSGQFEAVNQALCALTGRTSDDLCTMTFAAITHPDDVDLGTRARASMIEGLSNGYHTEKRLLHADGGFVWVGLSTAVVRDNEGRPLYFLSHFLDISDRKRFEAQLQHLADHDPLTGLANRRSFEATLDRQVASIARYGYAGALLVLDLDHFKQVNDTLGTHAGDELIVALAAVVRRRLRDTDVIGRLGGDEFAVMLPYATRDQAEVVATSLLDAVRAATTVLAGTHPRKVTTSIGIALFDDPQLTGAEMLVNADLAMYDAKEAGRDRYAIHQTAESRPTTRARLAWVDRIQDALEHDRFRLYAQPIMHLATRQVTRHELLLRMIDEDGDVETPATFLKVAEKFGLISRIDHWVVDHAITALATYHDRRPSFEVNLSGASMGDTDLLAFIERRLGETPEVDPAQLTFEVTETAAVANLGVARAFADRLTALGCSFSLDDFGAGFGSFYYLKYLPFHDLKIDGEFITQCLSNPTDQLVIDAVVTLAHGLGKHTIAEYVGDEATLDFLAGRGVDYAQGFHVGRPIPLEDAMERRSATTPPDPAASPNC